MLIGTDDLSHSCPRRYFTLTFTVAFVFVILKVINSELILFRFAFISVSMVIARINPQKFFRCPGCACSSDYSKLIPPKLFCVMSGGLHTLLVLTPPLTRNPITHIIPLELICVAF